MVGVGVGVGVGVVVGVGVAVGVAVAVAVAVGVAVAVAVAVGVVVGVGVGVVVGVVIRSRGLLLALFVLISSCTTGNRADDAPATAPVPAVAGVGTLPAPPPCIAYGPTRPLPDVLPANALYIEVRELDPTIVVTPAACAAFGSPTPPCTPAHPNACVRTEP